MNAGLNATSFTFRDRVKDILVFILKVGSLAVIVGAIALLSSYGTRLQAGFVDYLMVMILGLMVGFVEIISRYEDAPFPTAITWPGIFYMLVNALVAAAALWGIRLFGWNFLPSQSASAEITRWTQVLTAGLGAMAIFRSSLFVLGKEENAISIGPNAVLQILLTAIDKEVDRERGQQRARTVSRLMSQVNFDDGHIMAGNLVEIVKYLMQNLGEEDKKKIEGLRTVEGKVLLGGANDELQKYLLSLQIMDLVGENVLADAITIITDIGEKIRKNTPSPEQATPTADSSSKEIDAQKVSDQLDWMSALKQPQPDKPGDAMAVKDTAATPEQTASSKPPMSNAPAGADQSVAPQTGDTATDKNPPAVVG